MPGGQGRGFGRRRGLGRGYGRFTKMGRNPSRWSNFQGYQDTQDQRIDEQQPTAIEPSEELHRLKQRAETIQSQLKEINTRAAKTAKTSRKPYARIDETLCTGCGQCTSVCPQEAIALTNLGAQVDRDKCTGCGVCLSECPFNAIDLM